MKKWISACLLMLTFLLFAGCSEEVQEEGAYITYYLNKESGSMVETYYIPDSGDVDTRLLEVLTRMTTPPDVGNWELLLPEEVVLSSYRIDEDHIILDFSREYYEMDKRREILARAGFVKALSQIPEITDVSFTVEEEPLLDSYGKEVGAMNQDDFVDHTGMDVNSYTATTLTLYFLNQNEDGLVKEERSIYYNASIPLERVVIEELIGGPEKVSEGAVLSSDTMLMSVNEQDGTCFVSFNESMAPANADADPEWTIKAIVKSLSENCGVQKVQFSINGSTDAVFGGKVALDHPFNAEN